MEWRHEVERRSQATLAQNLKCTLHSRDCQAIVRFRMKRKSVNRFSQMLHFHQDQYCQSSQMYHELLQHDLSGMVRSFNQVCDRNYTGLNHINSNGFVFVKDDGLVLCICFDHCLKPSPMPYGLVIAAVRLHGCGYAHEYPPRLSTMLSVVPTLVVQKSNVIFQSAEYRGKVQKSLSLEK
nr:hypothetical protein CFP56_48713 [Quercus suber]